MGLASARMKSFLPLAATGACLAASLGSASAQFDLEKKLEVQGSGVGAADLAAQDDAELAWARAGVDYNRPLRDIPYDPSLEWGVHWGLEADWTTLQFDDAAGFEDHDLFRVRTPWQLIYRPGGEPGKWTYGAVGGVGLASDFGGLSFDDVQFSLLLAATYELTPTFELGAGAYYSTDFGSPLLLPGVGFRWKPSDDFKLYLLPPVAGIDWQVSDAWLVQLSLRPNGGYWHLHDEAVEGGENLSLSSWHAGLNLERKVGESGALFFGGGYAFNQRVEYADDDDDKVLGSDVGGAPFIRIGYRWEF